MPTPLAALATALLLSLATADPGDGAAASVPAVRVAGRTVTILHLRGLDRSVAHRSFGTHRHAGLCVPGNGTAAGPRPACVGVPF